MSAFTLDFVMCDPHHKNTFNPFFIGLNIGLAFVTSELGFVYFHTLKAAVNFNKNTRLHVGILFQLTFSEAISNQRQILGRLVDRTFGSTALMRITGLI